MLGFKKKTKTIESILKGGTKNYLPHIISSFNDLKVWHRDQECVQCPSLVNQSVLQKQRDQTLKKLDIVVLEESEPLLKSLAMLRKE